MKIQIRWIMLLSNDFVRKRFFHGGKWRLAIHTYAGTSGGTILTENNNHKKGSIYPVKQAKNSFGALFKKNPFKRQCLITWKKIHWWLLLSPGKIGFLRHTNPLS